MVELIGKFSLKQNYYICIYICSIEVTSAEYDDSVSMQNDSEIDSTRDESEYISVKQYSVLNEVCMVKLCHIIEDL